MVDCASTRPEHDDLRRRVARFVANEVEPHGYMRESAIERLVRDARVLAIGGGAIEVMLEKVAKRFKVPQWN